MQLGLEDAADKITKDKSIKAAVVRGAGTRAFCAGADIQDLNKKHERYPKRSFVEVFEELDVPVVAALQGFTLGGGFELSLGCHYRVMAENGVVGLPEVNIGLLPGGQGTQRLPRLIGCEAALDLMLSGSHVPAQKALQWKVIDKVVKAKTLIEEAVEFALSKVAVPIDNRRISTLPPPKADETLFRKLESTMKTKRRGQPAPLAIIDCVRAACKGPTFKDGINVEAQLFRTKCLGSPEANALQHVFFSE